MLLFIRLCTGTEDDSGVRAGKQLEQSSVFPLLPLGLGRQLQGADLLLGGHVDLRAGEQVFDGEDLQSRLFP